MFNMLSQSQEKIIKSLQTNKGRKETGLCLVEGEKNLKMANKFLEFSFTLDDSKNFKKLITTETPQNIAGVAKIPNWNKSDIEKKKIIIALDSVQDPGNIGTILRLALAFNASVILIDSADPTNPKAIRSSVGSIFKAPWIRMSEEEFINYSSTLNEYKKYRLELNKKSIKLKSGKSLGEKVLILAGSEGQGIKIKNNWDSLLIEHNKDLESLNVAQALGIVVWEAFNNI